MNLPEDALLLRIFIGESDRHEHRPLYEAIVMKAREAGLAGATVLRGPMGFGKSSHLHTAKILRLSMDLPMVIEIVDAADKVNAFLPLLDPMIGGGLVTIEKVKVIHYRHGGETGRDGALRRPLRALATRSRSPSVDSRAVRTPQRGVPTKAARA